ncbi:8-oxo-dGTP pyrophosphatase MutT (NUDIX family) [Bradyrhizobium sp. IAR9]|uniref:NUDIX hydrolase n=1 Tax=Bradyrhizobium sp. IAR9 TaxID=2663841 RepID=UPI001852BF62|nr:CoA pyrophosphatase [Bradyrhizobium sp. IAR9]NYG44825.1 8-oxo-dGTP pyrophosphatase MutT (NUDIX family) [Bradyrhizobium sp. IAR9]
MDEFFARARKHLSLEVPQALNDPNVAPHLDQDAGEDLIAAIAAARPIRTAAVLVPVVERKEPTILFTQRTSQLADHGGEIAFAGGKIDLRDASPVDAALREAEEEIGLDRRFVDPIGYLNVHAVPTGYRILPTLARVREGFSLRFNPGEVTDVFEAPLSFLMTPANFKREKADWKGLPTHVHALRFELHKIWGVTANILWNLRERLYTNR